LSLNLQIRWNHNWRRKTIWNWVLQIFWQKA